MSAHINCLDGIRGSLALWVLTGHTAHAVGFHPPLIGAPALAVDLFMLLSGFLMAWHWSLDRNKSAPLATRAKTFYVRRFFRIAPLYYALLIVALLLAPAYFAAQESVHDVYPYPWAAADGESLAPQEPSFTPTNLLVHASFLFGLIPKYAANNPLPDWSIGLEMQFYLIFPLLILFLRRTRVLFLTVASILIVFLNLKCFGLYLEPGRFGTFPQPSMILFKLHIFVGGMALGRLAAIHRSSGRISWPHAIAFALPLLLLHKYVIIGALGIATLILLDWKPTNLVRDLLGTRPFKLLGDLSYGIYLVHTLPLYFMLDALIERGIFEGHSPVVRLGIALATILPVVLLASWVLHRFLEIPGINLGRRLTRSWRQAQPAERTAPAIVSNPVAAEVTKLV